MSMKRRKKKRSKRIATSSLRSNAEKMFFSDFGNQLVEGVFSKIDLTSDGGILLIREVERITGIMKRVADCFTDLRHQSMVVQPLITLLKQRVVGFLLGYEDLNDHRELRKDKAMALLADTVGIIRKNCRALGGLMQIFRLDHAGPKSDSFNFDQPQFYQVLLDYCVERLKNSRQKRFFIDFDGTYAEIHGDQEGGKYNGHAKCKCLHTLLAFIGNIPIYGKVQPGNVRCAEATAQALNDIVPYLQRKLPNKQFIFRADGEFRTPELLLLCDKLGIDFVVGYASNETLKEKIEPQIKQVEKLHRDSGKTERIFTEFLWTPGNDSWQGRSFRVIAKVEYIAEVENPLNVRFIVSNLDPKYGGARKIYRDFYCGRGESELHIKENQRYLFGKRLSAHELSANQMRLNFAITAQLLANDIRRLAFKGTALENATFDTIRKKFIKVAAIVRNTKQRIYLEYSAYLPYKNLFTRACNRVHQEAIRIGKRQEGFG